MTADFIHQVIKTFFEENQCLVQEDPDGKIVVSLSEEMDKAMANRPFYWKYMEATNQKGIPLKWSFVTDKEKLNQDAEWVTYGSPRLQQIGKYLRKQAQFTRLFQVKNTQQQTMLHPWLLVNYCISYQGKQKKEKLYSIGLNLINGAMVSGMMEELQRIELAEVISNHCYTISPLVKLKSGFLRIENYIDSIIQNEEHQWAIQSHRKLEEEIGMIDYFYRKETDDKERQQEMTAAKKRFTPTITHGVISGGLFYLDQYFLSE